MYRILIMSNCVSEEFGQRLYRTMQIMQDTERVLNAIIGRKDLVSLKLKLKDNEELLYRLTSLISFHNKNPESELLDLFEGTAMQVELLNKLRAMSDEEYKEWLRQNTIK